MAGKRHTHKFNAFGVCACRMTKAEWLDRIANARKAAMKKKAKDREAIKEMGGVAGMPGWGSL